MLGRRGKDCIGMIEASRNCLVAAVDFPLSIRILGKMIEALAAVCLLGPDD